MQTAIISGLNLVHTPILNSTGEVKGGVSGRDITKRKTIEEQLRQMSLYDSLTELYNRSFF